MTKLPDRVLIGPISYSVKEIDDLHSVDDEGKKKWLHGHIMYADALIKVANDQSDDMKITTVWHELLHGIMDQAGIDEHPESLIRMLGYALVRLVQDNPELIKVTIGENDGRDGAE